MKHDRLDILAARFWSGECSDGEEQELKDLVSGEVPAAHAELKAYLEFTRAEQSDDLLGGDFDAMIMQEIKRKESSPNGYPTWMKIAAGIALLLGLFGAMQLMKESPSIDPNTEVLAMADDTFDDPEMAYEEVKKALALMGMKLNDGLDHAGSIGMFDQATETICNEKGHAKQ